MHQTNFKHELPTRKTLKRQRTEKKHANIAAVREQVEARDGERCRIEALLARFKFFRPMNERLELAHVAGRGMGGNQDLSRDTTENTMLASASLHQGGKHSMHGEMIAVEALTERGANGPIKVSFYEVSPKTAAARKGGDVDR